MSQKGRNMDEFCTKTEGLTVKNYKGWNIAIGAVDKILGAKIIDIRFTDELDGDFPQMIIDLDNGSQLEIYKHDDGDLLIESD